MRKKNIEEFIELDRLHEVMDYDPETGWLTWRITNRRCRKGERAGCVKKNGYRRVSIDRQSFPASHVAWYHFYGVGPEGDVLDYRNLDKDDNRIKNLREATYSENSQNIRRTVANSTGFKGVSVYNARYNRAKFRCSIRHNGERIFIGLFHTAEEAYEAYCKKAKELHGEFARTD